MFNQYYPGLQYNPTTDVVESEPQPAALKDDRFVILLVGLGILILLAFAPCFKRTIARGGSGMSGGRFIFPDLTRTVTDEITDIQEGYSPDDLIVTGILDPEILYAGSTYVTG